MSTYLRKFTERKPASVLWKANRILLCAIVCLSIFASRTHAQSNLAGWNFNNTFAPTAASVVSGVTALTSVPGPEIVGANLGQFFITLSGRTYFTANFWTQTQSVDLKDYVQFGLSPISNNRLYVSAVKVDLSYTQFLGDTGPQNVVIRSSLDDFDTDITTTFTGVSTSWQTITMPINSPVQSNSTITFRLYGYDSEGVIYTLRLDNLQLKGSVSNLSTTALSGLTATCINPSIAQSFTLTANGATGTVSMNAPSGFELAAQTGLNCPVTGYTSTLAVNPTSGIINQGICVRRIAGLTPGSVTTNMQLTVTGGGIATATIGLSGSTTAAPTVSVTSSTACQGQSLTLAAIPSPAGSYTYSWSPSPSTGQSTSLVTITTANTYSVLITDANGCTNTASALASFTPLPNPSFTGLPANYCFGAAPLLLTPATPGGSFSVSGLGSISSNNYVPPGSGAPGPATITYSVTSSGCSNTASASISLGDQLPTITNLLASSPVGNGTCSVKLTATGTGLTFTFTGPNGYVYTNAYRSAGTYNVSAIDVKDPGTYTLTILNGSCQTSAQVEVTGTVCPE